MVTNERGLTQRQSSHSHRHLSGNTCHFEEINGLCKSDERIWIILVFAVIQLPNKVFGRKFLLSSTINANQRLSALGRG